MTSDPPASGKVALRAAMRRLRAALAAECPDAAARAAAALPLGLLPRFTVAGGYHPIGSELDPRPVLDRLTAAGALLALPAALDRHAPLVFRTAGWPADFTPDSLGIPAPPAGAPPLTPDLIIAPVLAFDGSGGRLGQGGGCYDRTLEALRAAGRVFVIGLAYAGQEVGAVPVEAHDQGLDAILTQTGYRVVAKDMGCA